LIAVSAVQFQTGLRMPIAELAGLARRYGAELAVDGIQAAGVLDLDLGAAGAHYFVAGSHKWWTGLDGLAVLYVDPDARWRPRAAGWLGREDPIDFLLEGEGLLRYDKPARATPDALEAGVQSHAAVAALDAATELLEALGLARVEAHALAWQRAFAGGLAAEGIPTSRGEDPATFSSIVSVRPPAGLTVREVAARLAEAGIAVATPDGWLRVAPHWPNALAEVPAVVAAFRSLYGR
jgi:selenocysteine lyase/cysteine desulfurase